jgi:lysozyme
MEMSPMNIQQGINLIKQFEGLELTAYADKVNADGLPVTIGYGTTNAVLPSGTSFKLGDTITANTAESWLCMEVTNHICPSIDKLVNIVLSDGQYGALIDLCYNEGLGTLQHSDILKYINNGDIPNAQLELLHYDKAGGQDNRGILRRRLAEAVMFGPLSRDELISQALSGYDPEIA